MRPWARPFHRGVLASVLMLVSVSAMAADVPPLEKLTPPNIQQAYKQLDKLKHRLADEKANAAAITRCINELTLIQKKADQCIVVEKAWLQKINQLLEPITTASQTYLIHEKATRLAELTACGELSYKTMMLLSVANAKMEQYNHFSILIKGRPFLETFKWSLFSTIKFNADIIPQAIGWSVLDATQQRMSFLILFIGAGIGLFISLFTGAALKKIIKKNVFFKRIILLEAIKHFSPVIVPFLLLTGYYFNQGLMDSPNSRLFQISNALMLLFIVLGIVRVYVLLFMHWKKQVGNGALNTFIRWTRVLMILFFMDFIDNTLFFRSNIIALDWFETLVMIHVIWSNTAFFIVSIVLCKLRFRYGAWPSSKVYRHSVLILLATCCSIPFVLAWSGYTNLALCFFPKIINSLFVINLTVKWIRFLGRLDDKLQNPDRGWSKKNSYIARNQSG